MDMPSMVRGVGIAAAVLFGAGTTAACGERSANFTEVLTRTLCSHAQGLR